jgi:mannose-6-phosphate isomerase-like protein (cupin superfamily)
MPEHKVRIIDLADAPSVPMEEGRGETVLLVDGRLGTNAIDLHLNRLVPGGANGKRHRHTRSDNVYIVVSGQGRLQIEDEYQTIRKGQVVFIPAGVRHSLSNVSDDLFEIFEMYAPSGPDFDFIPDPAA